MPMGEPHLLLFVPLLGALLWAAAVDLRSRRISNVLTFSLAAAGLAQSVLPLHTVPPLASFAGLLVGLGLILIPLLLGGMGGGDAKLLAAVGAWIGPWPVFNVFLACGLFGLLVVLGQALYQGRLRKLFANSALLAVNLAHIGELGVDHVVDTGQRSASVDKPLPYAVSILVGTVAVLAGLSLQWGGA